MLGGALEKRKFSELIPPTLRADTQFLTIIRKLKNPVQKHLHLEQYAKPHVTARNP